MFMRVFRAFSFAHIVSNAKVGIVNVSAFLHPTRWLILVFQMCLLISFKILNERNTPWLFVYVLQCLLYSSSAGLFSLCCQWELIILFIYVYRQQIQRISYCQRICQWISTCWLISIVQTNQHLNQFYIKTSNIIFCNKSKLAKYEQVFIEIIMTES